MSLARRRAGTCQIDDVGADVPHMLEAGAFPLPLRLASNECPEPPLPAVLAAARAALDDINRYPDPKSERLRAALAQRYGVPVERIAIGNGSADILLAIGDALLKPRSEYVCAWPTFSLFRELAGRTGATARLVPLDHNNMHDLDAMKRAVTEHTRLLLLCNPNNPTSTALRLAKVAQLVAEVPPDVYVIIDEAYIEYSTLDHPDASLALLSTRQNLVFLRTFSKVYGLSALRIGYALAGSEVFVQAIDRVRQPYYCNAVAQAAAIEALKHSEVIAARIAATVRARGVLTEGLRALGISAADSQANFVWFELPTHAASEQDVVRGLAEQGVLVRPGSGLGQPGALRVSCGTPTQNAHFLQALAQLL
jgi:histidinol-phosphate aminotransferase